MKKTKRENFYNLNEKQKVSIVRGKNMPMTRKIIKT